MLREKQLVSSGSTECFKQQAHFDFPFVAVKIITLSSVFCARSATMADFGRLNPTY